GAIAQDRRPRREALRRAVDARHARYGRPDRAHDGQQAARARSMPTGWPCGELPLPRRAPEAQNALSRCCRRGWVDPAAERQGGLDAAFSTLEEEFAQEGMDFEENIEQRAYELDLFR